MDSQSQAVNMDVSELGHFISSRVQQQTTGPNAQLRDLENRYQQLLALVNQLQVGQNIGQQYNNPLRSNVKAAKPKAYSGLRGADPEVWLFQFNQYADINQLAEGDRVKLAATYTEGNGATWWRNLVTQRGNNISWREFQEGLISMFKPVNAKKIA